MNAAWVTLFGLAVFGLGYLFYSRHLAKVVFDLKDDEPMPSKTFADGVDFVPTNKHVLFGHHYASIAGAAPIIGPAIAAIWGWVPAVIWVIFGTVLMGAVHDFSALVISVRNQGKSIGQIAGTVLSPRARTLFLLVIFFLILIVIAVFATAIARLFVAQPGTVIPINFEIIVAIAMGYLCTKTKVKLLWPSIVALVALYFMVWVGTEVPVSFADLVGADNQHMLWVVMLLIYSFVASVIPVWILLQPRDFINSHQLVVGLGALILGVFITHPEITAPAFNAAPEGAPSIVPFLFVTIACGAISGFHGLVSSGTTSKQLECATDARVVGYGGMLGEGVLALIATLAVTAGLADWAGHYHSFPAAAKGGVTAFVEGAATFLGGVGIPNAPAKVVVAVLVISFAATSLDTGVRIQRYILQELGEAWNVGFLGNRYVAGAIAVILPLLLVIAGKERVLWPLFGASNQVLAGLTLIVVTVWLYRANRPWLYLAIPMVLVLVVSGGALTFNIVSYFEQGNYLLLSVGAMMLALQVWIIFEGIIALRRPKTMKATE